MILALLACEPGPLLDPHGWQAGSEDPWGAGEPCAGWAVEEAGVEVRTGDCPWVSLSQPLLRDARPGAEVLGGVLWDGLYADAPAEAVLGVAVDGAVVWEATAPIPQGSGDAPLRVDGAGWVAGAVVTLHVHNHGLNAYTWVPFRDE